MVARTGHGDGARQAHRDQVARWPRPDRRRMGWRSEPTQPAQPGVGRDLRPRRRTRSPRSRTGPTTDPITSRRSFPTARSSSRVAWAHSWTAASGQNSGARIAGAESYDPVAGTWTELPDMAERHHAGLVLAPCGRTRSSRPAVSPDLFGGPVDDEGRAVRPSDEQLVAGGVDTVPAGASGERGPCRMVGCSSTAAIRPTAGSSSPRIRAARSTTRSPTPGPRRATRPPIAGTARWSDSATARALLIGGFDARHRADRQGRTLRSRRVRAGEPRSAHRRDRRRRRPSGHRHLVPAARRWRSSDHGLQGDQCGAPVRRSTSIARRSSVTFTGLSDRETYAFTVAAGERRGTGAAAGSNAVRPTTPPPPPPDPFVTAVGTHLELDGQPFTFTGMNIYNANSDDWCANNMDNGLFEQALTDIGPRRRPRRRSRRDPGLVLPAARDARQDRTARLDPVRPDDRRGQGRRLPRHPDARQSVGRVRPQGRDGAATRRSTGTGPATPSSRRRTRSTRRMRRIATGSPRSSPATRTSRRSSPGSSSTRPRRTPTYPAACPPGPEAFDALAPWASDVSRRSIKSIDPNHLVSLGTIGTGQCGTSGGQYKDLHAIPTIDLCEYHDYDPWAAMPGDAFNGMALRIQQCGELGKPIFVGEVGLRPERHRWLVRQPRRLAAREAPGPAVGRRGRPRRLELGTGTAIAGRL